MIEPHPTLGIGYFLKDGEVVLWHQLAPGAMWINEGELCVKLPGGSGSEWNIDRGRLMNSDPDRVGKKPLSQWTRSGEPPNVTANPSINWVGTYHGWLKNGELTDDCEGRVL